MQKQVIEFIAGIEAAPVRKLMRATAEAVQEGAKEIQLHISSPGGNLYWGFSLHNHLRSLPVRLTTVNIGFVNSMAIAVYCAGTTRLSAPDAKFWFHAPTPFPEPNGATVSAAKMASIGIDASNMSSIIARATAQRKSRVTKDMQNRLALDASAALQYGLVHKVTPSFQSSGKLVV